MYTIILAKAPIFADEGKQLQDYRVVDPAPFFELSTLPSFHQHALSVFSLVS